jgi:polar amino acid transport system substrate-binding protein
MNGPTPRRRGHARRASGAAAALSALLLTACGSSAATQSATTGAASGQPTQQAVTAVSYDPAIAKLVPASIRQKGSLTVAMNATYPPDEYFATDNTTIIGFDPDLTAAVGKILGLRFKLSDVAFDDIIPGLQAGHFDLAWSSATITPEREQQVNFVSYFADGVGFLVPSSSTFTIHGLADLCGLPVAVEAGSLEDTTATSQSQKCVAAGKKPVELQRYQNENQNLLALTSDRAQVSTAGSQIIPYLVKQSNGQFKSVGSAYDVAPLGVEFPKTAPAGLIEAFQAALNKMIATGAYARILAKWGEQESAIKKAEILPAGAAGTADGS